MSHFLSRTIAFVLNKVCYLQACFGSLIIPNMAAGVEINGEVLLKLAGQGAVYIRELFPEDDD